MRTKYCGQSVKTVKPSKGPGGPSEGLNWADQVMAQVGAKEGLNWADLVRAQVGAKRVSTGLT